MPSYNIDFNKVNSIPTIKNKLLFIDLDFNCKKIYENMEKKYYDVINLSFKIQKESINCILNEILKYETIVTAEELFFLKDFTNNHNIIMIWHGEPAFLKNACNLFFKNYYPPFNHLVCGYRDNKKIIRQFGITNQQIHKLGDINIEEIMINIKTIDIKKIYDKYKIDKKIKKIYFIAFSFEQFPKSHINFLNFKSIEKKLGNDELIIYNIHPVVYKFEKKQYYNSNKIRFIQNVNKEEILSICNLFVTDYSSSIAESIVLDIPTLVLCENFYTYDRGYFYKKKDFPYPLLCSHNSAKIVKKFREISTLKPDVAIKNEIIYENAKNKIMSFLYSFVYNK